MCMVGLRLWESANSAATVDLLHVYSNDHKAKLCREVAGDWSWVQEETVQPEDRSLISFTDNGAAADVADALEPTPAVRDDQTDAEIDVDDI